MSLLGKVVRWESAAMSPLGLRLFESDSLIGRISASADLKPVVAAEIAGSSLRIAWTEHAFYRIATDDGLPVGEARFLPWRRDTFQTRLGHLRAYRLAHPSPGVAAWQLVGADAIEFRHEGNEASISATMEATDAAPLLALGVLLSAKGELFNP